MTAPSTQTLQVPGAALHVESRGQGPLLLLIPGGNGDAFPFQRLAEMLAERWRVVGYDRRGFSRSTLQEQAASDGRTRLDADVDDARRIIEAFGAGPAHVLASSSGAIIGLHLLLRHPEHVGTLVAHEPPLVDLLPDAAEHHAFFRAIDDTYRQSGVAAAMKKFLLGIGMTPSVPPSGELTAEMRASLERTRRNQSYWLENELLTYPSLTPDLAALQLLRSHLVLGVGRDSAGTFPHRPNLILAERLRMGLTEFAGGHVGFATHPAEFAARLGSVL